MAKVGRPKGSGIKEDEMFDEDGNPVSLSVGTKAQDALQFKRQVDGDVTYASKKGMYAGMANPESYIEFYKTSIGKPRKGRPWTYPTAQALQTEVTSYFEFCIDKRIAVTVAGLGAWLGITVTTLRLWKQNKDTMPFYEVVEPAIGFIHSMTEQGAMDGNIPAIAYIFSAKNYYGLKDVQEYVLEPRKQLSTAEQDSIINDLPEE